MSILSFLKPKSNASNKDEQKASLMMFELIHKGKNSEQDIFDLSEIIYRLAFKCTNREFVDPIDMQNPRNFIGNPNGMKLLKHFNVFKALLDTISSIPNNPIYGHSTDQKKECDVMIEVLIKNATNDINNI